MWTFDRHVDTENYQPRITEATSGFIVSKKYMMVYVLMSTSGQNEGSVIINHQNYGIGDKVLLIMKNFKIGEWRKLSPGENWSTDHSEQNVWWYYFLIEKDSSRKIIVVHHDKMNGQTKKQLDGSDDDFDRITYENDQGTNKIERAEKWSYPMRT